MKTPNDHVVIAPDAPDLLGTRRTGYEKDIAVHRHCAGNERRRFYIPSLQEA